MGVVSENFPDVSFIDNCTLDEVLTQMINDYQEKHKELTGKEASLAQADPYRLIMHACSVQVYQTMQYVDFAGKMGLLKYSRDEFLDNITPLKGVKRIEATAAITTLQFSIENAIESAIAIPTGTRVTNGNEVYFATDEYAEIPAGELSVTVSATCTEKGVVGNGFAAGEFNILVNTLPYVIKAVNIDNTSGGADTEDDDRLKDRVYHAPASYSTAGPEGAYIYHTKTVDSTISDVDVERTSAGVVTVSIICEGGKMPSETLIEKVSDYLMNENVRPLTDNVIVQAPAITEYSIDLTYYISSSNKSSVATIQENIDKAVAIYNTWQTEKIGRDINPDYLHQKIMEAGAKRVVISAPVFTALSKGTLASLGAVNVVYGGLEDD